jgi:hypothetical protein
VERPAVRPYRGSVPNFLGCSLGPSRSQVPSKEHIQLGWVVRWILSTPPGHPAAGRCCRVVPVPPLLLCTLYSPCASSAFDWGSKPPSRSALAPVGSSPGLVLSPVTALQFSRFAPLAQLRPNRDTITAGVVLLWSSRAMHSGAGDAP